MVQQCIGQSMDRAGSVSLRIYEFFFDTSTLRVVPTMTSLILSKLCFPLI